MAAQPPSSGAPAAAGNTKRTPKRKPKTKPAAPSALNPNWAQLQSKLPASTFLGKRKRPAPSPPPAPSPNPDAAELSFKLEPTSDDTSLTKALALDCEMVGVGAGGSKSALARATLCHASLLLCRANGKRLGCTGFPVELNGKNESRYSGPPCQLKMTIRKHIIQWNTLGVMSNN
uniref:Exonuclease domain-containing protein n=1 Tax=Aegilops tauschii TaxID=37682 RepID=M8CFY9_AEGTA